MATIFASCWRVSFSRHGILLLNLGMANFEGTHNSPVSKINARKFRSSIAVKTPTQELAKKIMES
jgi:hypothetical protein